MRRRITDALIELAPALAALIAALAHPWRGLSLWGLWLLEQTERINVWAAAPSDDTARAAFEGGAGLMPLPGMAAAALSGAGGELDALRILGAFAGAAFVWSVAAWGREMGGRVAGLAAGLLVLCVPRYHAMVSAVSPTVFTAASVAVMSIVWFRARRDPAWLAAALPATVLALGTSLYGWIALVPALVVFYLDVSQRPYRGEVNVRPATPLALVIPALAVLALIALVPWWHEHTGARLGMQLRWWIERPAEPALLGGTLYGARRIPLWAPALVTIYTTPVVVLVTAAGGLVWRFVRRDGAVAPAVWTWLAWALVLPVVLRSIWHGGNDLLVLSLPPLLAASGACVASGVRYVASIAGDRKVVTTAALGAVVAAAAVPVATSGGRYEAWYNGFIGGTDGAVARGYSRQAHAPVPPVVADALAGRQPARVAVVANAWEVVPVLHRYAAMGLVPTPIEVVPVASADLVLAAFDDGLPELYGVARDVTWLAEQEGAAAWTWSARDGTPLVVIAPVR